MSFCPINKNEDLLKVYKYVRTALEKQINDNKKVDPKAIARELYDYVLRKSNDPAKALSYAHLVPSLTRQAYGASDKVSGYMAQTNFDINAITNLAIDWKTNPLEKVSKYLGLDEEPIKQIEEAAEVQGNKNAAEESKEQNLLDNWITVRDYALPGDLLATTGQEAQTDADNQIPENNIKNPEVALYYSVQRQLVQSAEYPGVNGPVHMTMMTLSRIPVSKMYPKQRRETEEAPQLALGYNKVFINVLTDSNGNIIYFDPSGKVTTESEGVPIYFPARLSLEQVQKPDTEERAKQLKDQEALLKEMLDYIRKNPEQNQITSVIMGGSMGYTDDSKELVPIAGLSKFLYPKIEIRVGENGGPYMRVPRYQTDVALQMGEISEERARSIARLLLNPISDKNGKLLDDRAKASILFPYIAVTDSNFGFNAKTSTYFLGGKPVTQRTEDEIVKALMESEKDGQPVRSKYVYKNVKSINEFVLTPNQNGYSIENKYTPYDEFIYNTAGVYKKIDSATGDFIPFNSYLNFLPVGDFTAQALGVTEETPVSTDTKATFDSVIDQINKSLGYRRMTGMYENSPRIIFEFDGKEPSSPSFLTEPITKEGTFYRVKTSRYNVLIDDAFNIIQVVSAKGKVYTVKEDELSTVDIQSPLFDQLKTTDISTDAKVEEIEDNTIQNTKEKPEDIIGRIADELDDSDIFNLLDTQKKRNLEATKEQLKQAIPWYMSLTLPDGRKLSDVIPLNIAFNAVNMTSAGVATWTKSGITLWNGADTSDLYHEAWHGFSQVFLNKAEREKLYDFVRTKKGSFTDHLGNTVAYKDATKLQAEEWLAEQFREHMLRDGKGTYAADKKGIIAKIFDKIFSALKQLFGNTSTKDTLADAKANKEISAMFEKLRVGDLSSPSFEMEESFSEGLNKIKATRKDASVQVLGNADTNLVFASIDSLLSEAVDKLNAKYAASGKGYNTITTAISSDLKTRQAAYAYVKKQLEDKVATTMDRVLKRKGKPVNPTLKRKLDLLLWAYQNFGYVETPRGAKFAEGSGVIGAYEKSRFGGAVEEESDFQDLTAKSEYAERSGNEVSVMKLADPKLKYTMGTLLKYETYDDYLKNRYVTNDLGFPVLENPTKVLNELSNITEGSTNATEVYNVLNKLKNTSPIAAQFLNKVGNPAQATTQLESNMWLNIEKILTMPRVNVVNLDVVIEREVKTVKNKNNEDIQVKTKKITSVSIRPGEASRESTKVYKKMQSEFAAVQAGESNYIKKNPATGRNYLDLEAVYSDFAGSKHSANPYLFLKSLGVKMPDVESVHNALKDKATGFPQAISGLSAKLSSIRNFNNRMIAENKPESVVTIESVNQIFDDLSNEESKKQGLSSFEASNTLKKDLGKLYLRWTGDFSNSTVTTTTGKTKYERSRENTITKMASALNKGSNFKSVVEDENVVDNTGSGSINRMNHLSTQRHAWSKVSLLLDDLYYMKTPNQLRKSFETASGKVTEARINVLDMDGSKIREEELEIAGIKSSVSDPTTKLLQDFYMNLVYGTSEAVRHAGKSSTFLYQVVRSDGRKHYVSPDSFRKDSTGMSEGRRKVLSTMKGYLAAEFERIHKAKTEEDAKDKLLYRAKGNIVSLADTGSKFVMFDDILTPEQKTYIIGLQDKNITTVEQFLEMLDNNITLANGIDKQLNKYLDKLVLDTKTLLESSGAMDSPYLFDAIKRQTKLFDKNNPIGKKELAETLVEAYTFNQYLHNVETGIVFYGDPALYNHLKEEFHKRNAGIGSTGEIPSTDVSFQNFVNNRRGKYADSIYYTGKATTQKAYNGTFTSAVLADKVTKSEYLDEYIKAAQDQEEARLKELNKSEEFINDAKASIKKRFDEAYGSMKEGDAQGWISFDSYRLLMRSLNKWTPKHEALYNKVLTGQQISSEDVTQFFPVKKMQYWGPLATKGLPVYAFHKFSLMPLIPSVIKGTKLEQLHNKMVEQQIDYALFESGSKIGTIGSNGQFNNFISNTDRSISINDPDYTFTPNVVFADYMKDQTEIAPEYKGKVTFATQLRKLVEEGVMEYGVPIDYKTEITNPEERVKAWAAETNKEDESKLWIKIQAYETALKDLTGLLKKQLVNEIGWTDMNKPDLGKIVSFVESQLSKQEITDNELEFIHDLKNSTNINFDLSSYSSQIEKMLTAVVNKRLVRQKVNGEALIQVSSAGFEKNDKFTNASKEDIEKYGTNDLPFYKQNAEGTKAMKVKVALQGDFKKLLDLNDLDGIRIETRERLNALLKNEEWLDKDDNRKMVTMLGVRIPVQGLNSMEFMEVYEFLPEEAGNIIIPPAEIVAKSGSDFDIDKMTIQMPNISRSISNAKITNKVLEDLQANNPNLDFSKANVDLVLSLAQASAAQRQALSENDAAVLKAIEDLGTVDVTLDYESQSIKGLQNKLMFSAIDLISDPINFVSLITPNGTDIAKPISEELKDRTRDFSSSNTFASDTNKFSPTRIFEPLYNIYKLDYNAVGKAALGLGAVDNTYNAIFNRIGAYMSSHTKISTVEGESKFAERIPFLMNNRILMNHNKLNDRISLSHMYDVSNENKISDIFNQLINGWVDVEKDEWIFDLQGNKELAPVLLLLVQSGVPLKQAARFMSQPIIREYVKGSRLRRGPFSPLLGLDTDENQHAIDSRNNILFNDKTYGFNWTAEGFVSQNSFTNKPEKWMIFRKIAELTENASGDYFSESALDDRLTQFKANPEYNKFDRDVFMHFLELEQMAKGLTEIKLAMNYDTTRSGSLFEAREKLQKEVKAAQMRGFDPEVFQAILDNSPIGSFKIQDFMLDIWEPFFQVTSSKALNNYLEYEEIGKFIAKKTAFYGNNEGAIEAFRNQIVPFVFQNSYYSFNITKHYRGYNLDSELELKRADYLKRGAALENGKIYYDTTTVNENFMAGTYAASGNGVIDFFVKNNVAPLSPGAFSQFNKEKGKGLYQKYLLERESLRNAADMKFDTVAKTKDYKRILNNLKDLVESSNLKKSEKNKVTVDDATVKVWAYETYLRNVALDNLNLPSHLFYGPNSYANQFLNIKNDFPTLAKYYPIFEELDLNMSNEKNPTMNLVFRNSLLSADEKTLYAENIAELSNASYIVDKFKNISTEDANNIARFFSRFDLYAYIQGATTPKSTFNVLGAADPSNIARLIEPSVNNFISTLNKLEGMEYGNTSLQELVLDSYLAAFKEANPSKKTPARSRFKIFDDPNYKFYANPQMSDKAINEFVTSITKSAIPITVQQAQPATQVGPETKINIYAGTGENAELSNFASRPFTYNGISFPTVEHAFQYAKGEYYNAYAIDPSDTKTTPDTLRAKIDAHLKNILNANTAAQVKALGRKNIGVDFENGLWDQASSGIMKNLLLESFKQNPDALAKLLATGNATLTHTQDKGKWGTEFPRLLMEVRDELRGEQPTAQQAKADTTVNQQVTSAPVVSIPGVITLGKQSRTNASTFTLAAVKEENSQVASISKETFNAKNMAALAKSMPDVFFIGNGLAARPDKPKPNTSGYQESNVTLMQLTSTNYLGIPTKYISNVYQKDGSVKKDAVMTDDTYEDNIQAIETVLEGWLEAAGDKDIYLDSNGFGQELIGRDPSNPSSQLSPMVAPKTFVYLSKRLYEEFGFINPNSLGSSTVVNTIQSAQGVNEIELFNNLKDQVLSCSI
jgi:predicted NAD-dependent protein-ADP-ribosyltransferase YbiA (DUF1768 family)